MEDEEFNVIDTEEDVIQAQEYCFGKFMEHFTDNNGYDHSTIRWDKYWQRATDGKFVYRVCPYSDAVHTREFWNIAWGVPPE